MTWAAIGIIVILVCIIARMSVQAGDLREEARYLRDELAVGASLLADAIKDETNARRRERRAKLTVARYEAVIQGLRYETNLPTQAAGRRYDGDGL